MQDEVYYEATITLRDGEEVIVLGTLEFCMGEILRAKQMLKKAIVKLIGA